MIRAVVDTNILIRALIKPLGSVGPILHQLRRGVYTFLYSNILLEELVDVLSRPHIRRKYSLDDDDIEVLIALLLLRGEPIDPIESIHACRDPSDDKFLEIAVAGQADVIVTSDNDLLALHPFRGIAILKSSDFLKLLDNTFVSKTPNR